MRSSSKILTFFGLKTILVSFAAMILLCLSGSSLMEPAVALPGDAISVDGDDKDGFPPPPPDGRSMIVRVFLQGYYINQSEKKLRRARDFVDGQIVPRWPTENKSDEIIVSLHHKTDYSNVLHEVKNLTLLTTGWTVEFQVPQTVGEVTLDEVWVSVRHRNHIETVWHELVELTDGEGWQSETIVLDFTTAKLIDGELRDPSYGENQQQLGDGKFGIIAGYVNQDNRIDALDRAMVQSHLLQITRGYVPEDVDGDGRVDASDRAYVQSALLRIIRTALPENNKD